MNQFEFSCEIVHNVLDELRNANEYIRIAVFQIHIEDIFTVLNEKIKQGIRVEIITLPYDSINSNIRAKVTGLFENLKSNGAQLYFCRWNVGDPERTSTATGRWYSFHGKFIVTNKAAISLSANFTNKNCFDCSLISRDPKIILQYNFKFDELYNRFIKDTDGYSGSIRKEIINASPNAVELFNLPKIIETKIHEKYWITQYPSVLCPESMKMEDGVFVIPFDVRGRNLYEKIINSAEKYIYISTESFTDIDFADFLIRASIKNLKINILTGSISADFTDRMQAMLRDLLASNIRIKTTTEDLHAKFLLTDKHLVVGSINLNKMNLGFNRTKKFWRGNTETIALYSDKTIISNAETQYSSVFSDAIDIENFLIKRPLLKVTNILSKNFEIKSDKETRSLFAKFLLNEEINTKRLPTTIAEINKEVLTRLGKSKSGESEGIMTLIIYSLTKGRLSKSELEENVGTLATMCDLSALIDILMRENFIEQDNNYYKLK